jgi:hypothetical protein
MWELYSGSGEQPVYGCLNPRCKKYLGQFFQHRFYILICYLLKLCGASILSVGLAAHTTRFQSHYRSAYFLGGVYAIFFALCLTGLVSIATFSEQTLRTDPKTNWLAEQEAPFNYFPASVLPNDSPWFSI